MKKAASFPAKQTIVVPIIITLIKCAFANHAANALTSSFEPLTRAAALVLLLIIAFVPALRVLAQNIPTDKLTAEAPAGPIYPLKASVNNRHLVDQNNTPFMMVGDSPQV
jgi:hypothetical protein